jgi:hypothetical protein
MAADEGRELELADFDWISADLAISYGSDDFESAARLSGPPYSRRYDACLDVPTSLAVEVSPL